MPERTGQYQAQIRCSLQEFQIFILVLTHSFDVVVARKGKSYYCEVGCKDVTVLKLRILQFGDEIFLIQFSVFQNNLMVQFCYTTV